HEGRSVPPAGFFRYGSNGSWAPGSGPSGTSGDAPPSVGAGVGVAYTAMWPCEIDAEPESATATGASQIAPLTAAAVIHGDRYLIFFVMKLSPVCESASACV